MKKEEFLNRYKKLFAYAYKINFQNAFFCLITFKKLLK